MTKFHKQRRTLLALAVMSICSGSSVALQAQIEFDPQALLTTTGQQLNASGSVHGISAYDYDQDGLVDLLVTGYSGATRLFHNEGNWSWTDRTDLLNLELSSSYNTAVWGDLDADGDADLVLGNAANASHRLYRNDLTSGFADVTATSGFEVAEPRATQSINLADVDGDGQIDCYVTRSNASPLLYMNHGGFQFTEQASIRGLTHVGVAMGAIFTDVDADGDLDLYQTYDARQPNLLYINDGSGHFLDETNRTPLGDRGFGMGAIREDLDGDGRLDFYVTNLYDNSFFATSIIPEADYIEYAREAGIADRGMSWGMASFDADHDGNLELFVANETAFTVDGQRLKSQLFEGLGGGEFGPVKVDGFDFGTDDFGTVAADLDQDGDLDLVVVSRPTGLQILRNESDFAANKAITISGLPAGARVAGFAERRVYMSEVHAGSGYASQGSNTVHIGVGIVTALDSLQVFLPGVTLPVYAAYGLPTGRAYGFQSSRQGYRLYERSVTATYSSSLPTAWISPNPAEAGQALALRVAPGARSQPATLQLHGSMGTQHSILVAPDQVEVTLPDLATGIYTARLVIANGEYWQQRLMIK